MFRFAKHFFPFSSRCGGKLMEGVIKFIGRQHFLRRRKFKQKYPRLGKRKNCRKETEKKIVSEAHIELVLIFYVTAY